MANSQLPGQSRKFKGIILSGTFSPIHTGHVKLFDSAFELAEKVFIGLTSDNLARNKDPPPPNYDFRKERLVSWLSSRSIPENRFEIIPIDDIFGFSLDPKIPVDSIIGTEETIYNIEKINKERKRRGLLQLGPVIVELVRDQKGEKIASRRIRAKEQDSSYVVWQ